MPGPVKVGFEAVGGHEWALWNMLAAAGIAAGQLPPAHSLSDADMPERVGTHRRVHALPGGRLLCK